MKKLLSVLSIVLIITVAKAQQTTGAINQAPATSSNTVTVNDKQSHDASKECTTSGTAASEKKHKDKSKSCAAQCESSRAASNSATESMSAEHVATGSAVIATSTSDDKCKGMKGKSCCKGMSKASALNTTPQVQPVSEPAPEAAPKQ